MNEFVLINSYSDISSRKNVVITINYCLVKDRNIISRNYCLVKDNLKLENYESYFLIYCCRIIHQSPYCSLNLKTGNASYNYPTKGFTWKVDLV